MQPKLSLSENWVPGFSSNELQDGLPVSFHRKWMGNSAHLEGRDSNSAQHASLLSLYLVLTLGHQLLLYLSENRQQEQETELMLYLVYRSLA